MKKKIVSFGCALGIWTTTLFAQQGIVPAGGNASGTGGAVSYSIGQTFYGTASSTSNNIVQGLQQPYEITVTGVDEAAASAKIELNATVYPSPATDLFTLKIENFDLKNLRYALFDAAGRLVTQGKIESAETVIQASALAESYYFLRVLDSEKAIKIFKILKAY